MSFPVGSFSVRPVHVPHVVTAHRGGAGVWIAEPLFLRSATQTSRAQKTFEERGLLPTHRHWPVVNAPGICVLNTTVPCLLITGWLNESIESPCSPCCTQCPHSSIRTQDPGPQLCPGAAVGRAPGLALRQVPSCRGRLLFASRLDQGSRRLCSTGRLGGSCQHLPPWMAGEGKVAQALTLSSPS